ncbi:MAG: transporter substrate-binding domain-containing protein [Rubrivivax sp.]|jgi:polar amino acid transport system substrate-binding protein|nr:transporter substrate-binding domain-containing protein [Rubrivivax sp.]MBK8528631.1 transporter substrate-binding domain-containing protein [Rubrivivax sp.]
MKTSILKTTFVVMLGAMAGAASAQEKPLVTGVDGTFAPHAMAKIGGGVEGFNVDLMHEIGRQLGRKVEVMAAEFSGLIPAMNAKTIDFVGAPTTVTPERAQNLLFSEGYLNTYYQFLVPAGKPDLKTLAELKGKTISANKGSAYDKWLIDNATKYGFQVEAYPTNSDAVQAVLSGRADATLGGNTVSAYAALKNPGKLRITTLTVDDGLVWATVFRKDDPKLRNAVDEAIECLKKEGTIARLSEKWFGVKPAPGSAAVTPFPGHGVPGLAGYDATPSAAKCK